MNTNDARPDEAASRFETAATPWSRFPLKTVAMTSAATIVVLLVGQVCWKIYEDAGQGSLMVKAEQGTAVAALLDRDGEPVIPAFTLPTQLPLKVPAGSYQVRVAHRGELSTTHTFDVPRDQPIHLDITKDQQQLWSIEVAGEFYATTSSDGSNIVSIGPEGVKYHIGKTGEVRWYFDPAAHLDSLRKVARGLLWTHEQFAVDRDGEFRDQRWHVASSTDINGDDIEDVVITSARQAWLLALNGESGEVLWFAPRGSDVIAPSEELLESERRWLLISAVIDGPHMIDDVDGDQIPDALVSVIDTQQQSSIDDAEGETLRWVEAISGQTGERIWRCELDEDWFALPNGERPPKGLSWFMDGGTHHSSGRHSGGSPYRRGRGQFERRGQVRYAPGPLMLPSERDSALTVQCGQNLLRIDGSTGEKLGREKLDTRPSLPRRAANLIGDASPELISVRSVVSQDPKDPKSMQVVAWSPSEPRPLWAKVFPAAFPNSASRNLKRPYFPLAEDLDGDGLCEVILPTESPEISGADAAWGKLSVLEGATGEARWTRVLPTADQQVDHFLGGPDVNADGHREVFAVTIWGSQMEVYVDCLSGKDGSTLWRASHLMRLSRLGGGDFFLQPPSWWQDGPDGWPQLIVPVANGYRTNSTELLLFSAATGRVTHTARGIVETRTADVDGDRYQDLLLYSSRKEKGGRLSCVRGGVVNRVKSITSKLQTSASRVQWEAVADFDADGTDDLVQIAGDGVLRASSTVQGTLLWETTIPRIRSPNALTVLHADSLSDPELLDLSGDGVPDVLLSYNSSQGPGYSPVLAISGSTGRKLWDAGFTTDGQANSARLTVADTSGTGRPSVVVVGNFLRGNSVRIGGSIQGELSLVVLDGRTGRVKWRDDFVSNANPWSGPGQVNWFDGACVDLDGNGASEILMIGQPADGSSLFELRAYGLRGEELWKHPFGSAVNAVGRFPAATSTAVPFAAHDIDGDGNKEIVVLHYGSGNGPIVEAQVVDSRNGRVRFDWQTIVPGNDYQTPFSEVQPVVLNRGSGNPYLCIDRASSLDALYIVDSSGNPVASTKPAAEGSVAPPATEPVYVAACDVSNDGNDELVVATKSRLTVIRPEQRHTPLGEVELGDSDRVLEVKSAPGTGPSTIVLQASARKEIVGLNAADGKQLWRCPAPTSIPGYQHADPPRAILFNRKSPDQPPHLLFTGGLETICRQAMPVRDGHSKTEDWRLLPKLPRLGRDPRLARRLPWSPFHDYFHWKRNLTFAAWSSLLAVILFVIPGRLAGHFVANRQWSIRTMFVIPVVVGLMIVILRIEGPYFDYHFPKSRWISAMMAMPGLCFAYYTIRNLVQRRWRLLLIYSSITIGLGITLAAITLSSQASQPGAYYTMDGWYVILLFAAHILGCMLALAGPIIWFVTIATPGHRRANQGR